MTRIVTNELLHPTRRVITNWKSEFMTSDGPNLSSKINLIDLGIPYDSHYRSRIVLPADTQDYFLHYGTLENVTFLMIKVTYNGNYDYAMEDDFDPFYRYEPETYAINYYFEGNSGKTYPIGRLLVLNGSFTTPLTKIYLNNPLDYDVVLDVLHANIDPPKSTPTSSAITISNLYYTDIITNQVPCSGNTGYTGSTAFIISEYVPVAPSGYTINEYYIAYNTILSFHKDSTYPIIFLYTTSYTIFLKFLTQFDCDQAYSRMVFAYDSYLLETCRYLTEDGTFENNSGTTGADVTPPVIYYNPSPSGITWIGSGTTVPSGPDPLNPTATPYIILPFVYNDVTGWTLDSLKNLFISGIMDNRDGNISLSSITFNLYETGYPTPLTGITHDGIYNIIISVTDTAGNTTTQYIINIMVDNEPPVIVYRYGVLSPHITGDTTMFSGASSAITSGIIVTSGFSFNLTGFTPVYIGRMEIINNIVDYVYDLIDIDLNKYMLDVLIVGLDGTQTYYITYSGITNPGYYLVKLSISDRSGNYIENYLIMNMNYVESCFSFGFWKDERVWIDTTYWKDHVFG